MIPGQLGIYKGNRRANFNCSRAPRFVTYDADKSVFLSYILIQHLHEGKPMTLQTTGHPLSPFSRQGDFSVAQQSKVPRSRWLGTDRFI